MYSHILVATDGSEFAQTGVDHGLSLAKRLGSKVTVITVTEPIPISGASATGWIALPTDFEGYDANQKKFADSVLSEVKAAADKMGVEVDTVHVPNAHAATAIVETADELGCNLIVMASHGRRGLTKILLGSQTAEVLVSTKIPVLVIR